MQCHHSDLMLMMLKNQHVMIMEQRILILVIFAMKNQSKGNLLSKTMLMNTFHFMHPSVPEGDNALFPNE